jgi:acyl-CoA thioesterase I
MIRTTIWKPLVAFASLLAVLSAATPKDQAVAQDSGREIVIVALGDSLTAGYQLPQPDAFPVQLEKALKSRGANVKVINAGVSGDTASDGLARLDWALPEEADAVIVELGANDALRGIPVAETTRVLTDLMERLKTRKLPVLLAGMEAPRNWGPDYVAAFRTMYADLARKYDTVFYPFFLDGMAMDKSLTLPDGLHPTGKGVATIVERILPSAEELMSRVQKRRGEPS